MRGNATNMRHRLQTKPVRPFNLVNMKNDNDPMRDWNLHWHLICHALANLLTELFSNSLSELKCLAVENLAIIVECN